MSDRVRILIAGLLASWGCLANADKPGDWPQRFERAQWVSLVTVEAVTDLVHPAWVDQGVWSVQGYGYQVTRLEDWKQPTAPRFNLQVELAACRQRLTVGADYLVFGSTDSRGQRVIRDCDDVLPRTLVQSRYPGMGQATTLAWEMTTRPLKVPE